MKAKNLKETVNEDSDAKPPLGELSEHLRLVHFTLMLSAIVLLVAASSDKTARIDVAIQQAEQIQHLQKDLLGNPTWLEEHAELVYGREKISRLADADDVPKSIGVMVGSTKADQLFRVTESAVPRWTLRMDGPIPLEKPTASLDRNRIPADALSTSPVVTQCPKTIEEFRQFWNSLRHRQIAILIGFKPLSAESSDPDRGGSPAVARFATLAELEGLKGNHSDSWLLIPNTPNPRSIRLHLIGRSGVIHYDCESEIPVIKVDIKAQEKMREFVGEKWPVGNFENSFPELGEFTKGLAALTLEDTLSALKNERSRAAGDVEIVGIKLTERLVTGWGSLLLLAIGGYLVIHLMEFLRLLRTVPRAPALNWFALYPSVAGRGIFIVSAIILPFTTICILARKAWTGELPSFGPTAAVISLALSAILSLLVLCNIWHIWKRLPLRGA